MTRPLLFLLAGALVLLDSAPGHRFIVDRISGLETATGLKIRIESTLNAGDCQVRSRFGLTDARLQTKLTALEHNLLPA